ncbi:Protein TAPT1 like [Fagus crenata]
MDHGNSLRSMTTIGNEKEQERVYATIFCLPWRCDFVIDRIENLGHGSQISNCWDGILKPRIYGIRSIRFRGGLAWVLRGCGGRLIAAAYCRSEPQPMKKPLVGAVVGVAVRGLIDEKPLIGL